ncbi:MAG: sorbosone dehydrogenase family protein, partial [Steroidobacter sp.]
MMVSQLYPGTGGHYTRDLVFSSDGQKMFVSIGSMSNAAEDMPKKDAKEIAAWEAQHGLGAAWASEENRADVLVYDMNPGRPGTAKVFATGIRNCVGLAIQPESDTVWCTANERD